MLYRTLLNLRGWTRWCPLGTLGVHSNLTHSVSLWSSPLWVSSLWLLYSNMMSVCLLSPCASTCQLSPANFEPSAQCQCNLTEAKKPYFLQRIHRHHGLGGIIRLREIIITQEKLHCHRSKNSSGPKSTQNQLQQICPFFSFFLTNGSLPVTRLSLENCKG